MRTVEGHSSKFRWVERCKAWDNHQQHERDKVKLAWERKWEARRLAEIEAVWQDAMALRQKGAKMLAFPLQTSTVEERYPDGRPKVTVVAPAKWTFQVAALVLKTAAEMAAAALTAVGKDPAEMDGEELKGAADAEAGAADPEPGAG